MQLKTFRYVTYQVLTYLCFLHGRVELVGFEHMGCVPDLAPAMLHAQAAHCIPRSVSMRPVHGM